MHAAFSDTSQVTDNTKQPKQQFKYSSSTYNVQVRFYLPDLSFQEVASADPSERGFQQKAPLRNELYARHKVTERNRYILLIWSCCLLLFICSKRERWEGREIRIVWLFGDGICLDICPHPRSTSTNPSTNTCTNTCTSTSTSSKEKEVIDGCKEGRQSCGVFVQITKIGMRDDVRRPQTLPKIHPRSFERYLSLVGLVQAMRQLLLCVESTVIPRIQRVYTDARDTVIRVNN